MSQLHSEFNNDSPIEVLWGAKAIGEYVGLKERQTFYLLEKGKLPGTKIGATWTSTKNRLRALFGERLLGEASDQGGA